MFYISSFFFFSECQNSWVKSSITLCINQILQNSRTHTNTHIFLAKYFCQHGDIQIYVLCDHESSQKSGSLLKAGNDSHLRRMEPKKKKKRKTETHHNFVKKQDHACFLRIVTRDDSVVDSIPILPKRSVYCIIADLCCGDVV